VHRLACKGAKVYLAARNESRATEAIEKLKAEGLGPGNGEIVWVKLDLCDIRGTKAAAEEIMKKEKRLDILSMSFCKQDAKVFLTLIHTVNNAAW
jgi:NAD(P)-dependent dehydrogenase (short-subunit alcohol dehydrogenase family)